jgi:AcrR family transcriptional regulator
VPQASPSAPPEQAPARQAPPTQAPARQARSGPVPVQGGAHGAPRRERKKQQTRDALVQAALRLFETKGYEHTAVRAITEAVDVSERTFFRYFASKEDLTLSFIREATQGLLEALAARPAEEDPLTALRAALHVQLRDLCALEGSTGDVGTYLSVIKLIEETPSLLAAHLRYSHEHNDEIVRVLAEREGVDPATDLRPRILAATFGTLVFLANRDWRANGDASIEAMLASFDAYADQLGPALSGHWAPGPASTPGTG